MTGTENTGVYRRAAEDAKERGRTGVYTEKRRHGGGVVDYRLFRLYALNGFLEDFMGEDWKHISTDSADEGDGE
jgi:hypothetical protein